MAVSEVNMFDAPAVSMAFKPFVVLFILICCFIYQKIMMQKENSNLL